MLAIIELVIEAVLKLIYSLIVGDKNKISARIGNGAELKIEPKNEEKP